MGAAEFTEQVVEERIDKTVEEAKKLVAEILGANDVLIKEIKASMAKGVDVIPIQQLQEWGIAIPIIIEDIVSYREEYSLARELWKIEERQMGAKNLLEMDMKISEIERLNRVVGSPHKKREAIAQYVQNTLAGYQEALWVLSTSVRRMLEIKMAGGQI